MAYKFSRTASAAFAVLDARQVDSVEDLVVALDEAEAVGGSGPEPTCRHNAGYYDVEAHTLRSGLVVSVAPDGAIIFAIGCP